MPYRLKGAIYTVRCRYPRCSFHHQFEVDHNIMGMTEKDVEDEARKIARDMGLIKHDAIYGTKHSLKNPDIRKISGSFQLIGSDSAYRPGAHSGLAYRDFHKGDIILRKGDDATTVCEVVRGFAYPARNRGHRYGVGDCFGAAALLANQNRTTDVLAGKDGTRIAFYNVIELSKHDPRKARLLYTRAMEDMFIVVRELEQALDRLERRTVREPV